MVAKKARAKVTGEKMESTIPASPILVAPMLVSLFGIIKTSLETEMEVGEQPIEVGVDAKLEVKASGQPIEEGDAGPEEEARVDD